MKLSTCLILRDEGKTIYTCLDSCKHITDQFVIGIDSKTSDNTREEVKRFFADNPQLNKDIYEYEWNNSFCDARNDGMDKATGDYILILDGHEYFPKTYFNITENRELPIQDILKDVKEQIFNEKCDEAFFHLYQQPFIGNVPNNYFLQPRIYRNGKGKNGKMIRFGRNSHNVIQNTDPEQSLQFPEVILIHDAPEDNRAWRKEQRIEMNTKRLTDDIEKNPNDRRAYFYLGNTHMEAKLFDKAIECFEKYCSIDAPNTSEKYQVLYHWALCLKEKKQLPSAIDKLYQAVRIDPTRRDAYLLIGDLCMEQDLLEEAKHAINNALILKPKMSRMFSNGSVNTWMPYERMAQVLEKEGDLVQASAHLKMAIRYMDVPEWRDLLKSWSGNSQNVLVIDAIGSFTQPLVESMKDDCINVVYVKQYDKKLASWADVIFQEWADNNLAQNEYPQKTICRVHGYEAYVNKRLFEEVKDRGFKFVTVAEHIKAMLPVESTVIHNGVDLSKYYDMRKNRISKSIGYAGFMNTKKNPMRLAEIIKSYAEYKFHLRIDWQDEFLKSSFEYETKDCKNIVYHARYNNVADFWNTMEYCISFSDIESFSFNIGEGIACGCKPLIYNWKGAKETWGNDFIFNSIQDLERVILSSKKCRKIVEQKYDQKGQVKKLKDLIYGTR